MSSGIINLRTPLDSAKFGLFSSLGVLATYVMYKGVVCTGKYIYSRFRRSPSCLCADCKCTTGQCGSGECPSNDQTKKSQ